MDEIQRKIVKQSKRNVVIRLFHAKNDKETIAVWNLEFNRALQILHVCSLGPFRRLLTAPPPLQIELAINNTLTVADIRRRERRSVSATLFYNCLHFAGSFSTAIFWLPLGRIGAQHRRDMTHTSGKQPLKPNAPPCACIGVESYVYSQRACIEWQLEGCTWNCHMGSWTSQSTMPLWVVPVGGLTFFLTG